MSDDGVGFDPKQKSQDGRQHVGLDNVRKRLENMSGGTLKIESIIGVGTQATIRILKEEAL